MAHMKRGLGQTSGITLIILAVGLFMVPMTAWAQSPTPSPPAKSAVL